MKVQIKLKLNNQNLIFKNVKAVYIENNFLLIEEEIEHKIKRVHAFDLFCTEYWTEQPEKGEFLEKVKK